MYEHASSDMPMRLPSTVQGCRDRLAAVQDEMASIRIQIATTDIRRQTEKKSLDPTWFHRAKTALRLKQQELVHLTAQIAKLSAGQGGAHRERFKDALIEVLRADCDEDRWQAAVSRARALQAEREMQHG